MPNIKIYVDERNCPAASVAVRGSLPALRTLVCEGLEVPVAACQFAVIVVSGMDDQPAINTEMHMLPGPARTPEHLRNVARRLRDALAEVTGLSVAVRMASLDPETYVALK